MIQSARYVLRRFSRFSAYFGLAAWAIGTVIVLAIGNPDLFQRFGALGVAASVLFFSDRLAQIELDRQKSVEKLLHEYGLELAAMRQGTSPQDIPQEGYAVDFLTEERHFDMLRQRADLFNFCNVLLLTVATLQWGFGDHMINHFICGAAQCHP